MAKYVTIPEPAEIRDPVTDESTGEVVPFLKTARIVCALAAQQVDALTLIDIRRKLTSASVGDVVELTDEEHGAVVAHFRAPKGVAPALIFSAEAHLRAVVDATSKRPAHAATESKKEP
jgi:hypothetical protein